MTKVFNLKADFIRERNLFINEVASSAPDVELLMDCLAGIFIAVLLSLDNDDEDIDGRCKQAGTVFTIGKSVYDPGMPAPDILQVLAEATRQDYEDLLRGWFSVRSFVSPDQWGIGASILRDLREHFKPEDD